MRIVELIVPHAHFDSRETLPIFVTAIDGSERRQNLRRARVVKRVGRVIGRNRLVLEHVDIPRQLALQDAHDAVCPRRLRSGALDEAHQNGDRRETETHHDSVVRDWRIITQYDSDIALQRGCSSSLAWYFND